MKDNVTDTRKNLLRSFELNLHLLFTDKSGELRKARFLEVLEKVNAAGNCLCSFETINEVADEVFNKNELAELDVEVVVDKMKVAIDHGRVFSRLLVENGLVDSLRNFLESRVLPVMKLNRCELNYDILSQLRDMFVSNARYKNMLFENLFRSYNKRFVSNLIVFIKDEFVQDQLRSVFKKLLVEELKFVLHKAGSDLASFVK